MTSGSERRLRADAAQNADRLIAAAIRVGLGEGRAVPLARIAAEAGVGVGTLYRRYPSREALLEAMQERAAGILIGEAEAALRDGDSGLDSIERFLRAAFLRRDELVLPMLGAPAFQGAEVLRLRDQLRRSVDAIVARGHTDGTVRQDVSAQTVVRFGSMLAQPMTTVVGWSEIADEQRRVFLRGIAGNGA